MNNNEKNIPFWTDIHSVPSRYPWLDNNESCDICVIGGGAVGTAIAYALSENGIDTVLVSASPIGYGDTSKAPASVRYDGLGTLKKLNKKIGTENAVYIYRKAKELMEKLKEFNDVCEHSFDFSYRDSVLFTDSKSELDGLNQEYLMRKHNGFDVEFITRETARNVFSFDIEGAIISKNSAAELDPYLLTHSFAAQAVKNGARVYENSKIVSIKSGSSSTLLHASTRRSVTAKTIVLAIGYENDDYIESLCGVKTSGAIVSSPIDYFTGWPGKCIISSYENSEVTVSSTPDDRMFIYGSLPGVVDFNGKIAGVLPAPSFINNKFNTLKNVSDYMFPGIAPVNFDYKFSSLSVCTPNGLPVVDRHPDYSNCFFAACPENSAALFSSFCADAVLQLYRGEEKAEQKLFSL